MKKALLVLSIIFVLVAFVSCRNETPKAIAGTPTLSSANAFSTTYQQKIIVPAGTLAAYQAATNWSTFASIMEEAAA